MRYGVASCLVRSHVIPAVIGDIALWQEPVILKRIVCKNIQVRTIETKLTLWSQFCSKNAIFQLLGGPIWVHVRADMGSREGRYGFSRAG